MEFWALYLALLGSFAVGIGLLYLIIWVLFGGWKK